MPFTFQLEILKFHFLEIQKKWAKLNIKIEEKKLWLFTQEHADPIHIILFHM